MSEKKQSFCIHQLQYNATCLKFALGQNIFGPVAGFGGDAVCGHTAYATFSPILQHNKLIITLLNSQQLHYL